MLLFNKCLWILIIKIKWTNLDFLVVAVLVVGVIMVEIISYYSEEQGQMEETKCKTEGQRLLKGW